MASGIPFGARFEFGAHLDSLSGRFADSRPHGLACEAYLLDSMRKVGDALAVTHRSL
jgi:hypothetical protein